MFIVRYCNNKYLSYVKFDVHDKEKISNDLTLQIVLKRNH